MLKWNAVDSDFINSKRALIRILEMMQMAKTCAEMQMENTLGKTMFTQDPEALPGTKDELNYICLLIIKMI